MTEPAARPTPVTPGVPTTDSLWFLLQAGEALAASLDYRTTLTTLVQLAVPAIADWCAVDLLDEAGNLQRLAVAHRDPAKIELVREIEARYPPDRASPSGSYQRLARRRTDLIPRITDEMLANVAQDQVHLKMIRALGLRSLISVPLVSRGNALGLFTMVTAESGREYGERDRQLAVDLARRAATAIDHARTYEGALDIASQLEAQAAELEVQTEELRDAEHFARSVVEAISDPMVIYDQQWHVRYENAAAVRVFSALNRPRSMMGLSLWDEFPDLRGTAFEREMRRAMDERKPTSFVEFRRESGRWTDVTCYPLHDGGIAAVWRDITAQKRAEQEALDARRAAEEANRAKTEFLTRMSHELRTPLNAIGGYTELLAMGIRGPVTPEQRSDLERIARSQHHLLTLINDVLNYAKLEAGRLQYNLKPVSLADSLEGLEQMFAPQLQERRLAYRLEPVDRRTCVLADADRLQQILLNLVSNAVKFTDPGGTITVRARASQDAVEIIVADSGRGIPPDKLEMVFEPFVQLNRSGEVPQGTGLGLSISRDLARAMNGDLRAESVGRGTTFIVSLPAATGSAEGGPG